MKTYSVIRKTDLYHASNDSRFDRNGIQILQDGLTLKEAQEQLRRDFCESADCYVPNWGVAVNMKKSSVEAKATFSDGTRCYYDDIYTYSIEPESDPTVAKGIFRQVGGERFARLFFYGDDSITFDTPDGEEIGSLADEEVFFNTLEVFHAGESRKFNTLREAAEYLYDIYNTEPEDEE